MRFILQPKGVFHPKLYIFWDQKCWEALIGSANLTSNALTNNSEVMVLISGQNEKAEEFKKKILSLIKDYWTAAEMANKDTVAAYRAQWLRQQSNLRRISGQYGDAPSKKSPIKSKIMSMNWKEYYNIINKADSLKERYEVLKLIRSFFSQHEHFSSMSEDVRKLIAGLPNDFNIEQGWFGGMGGAGYFHSAVKNNNKFLSKALAHIPRDGVVNHYQYNNYVKEFIKAFPNGRHGVGTASRLLAMKRSDQFICFNDKNRISLCTDFGIPKTGMNYERYWNEIIERIMDTPWWNSPYPKQQKQKFIWNSRAALLDTIFYNE